MITSMRRCVACDDLWPWPISSRSFDHDFENRVCSVMFSVLDRLFCWLGIQYDPIVWVIMRRRGVSSERRRSSCSSWLWSLLLLFLPLFPHRCQPAYVKYSFYKQAPHQSVGREQDQAVYWEDIHVVLTGQHNYCQISNIRCTNS